MKELLHLDKVQELMAICFEYQNKGLGDAFFDIMGHVEKVSVKLCDNGWKKDVHKSFEFEAYLIDGCVDEINKAISDIRSLIDNAKPFKERQKEIEAARIAEKRKQLEELSKELNVKIIG